MTVDDSNRLHEAIKQTQLVIDNTEQGDSRRHLEQGLEHLNQALDSAEREDGE
jgi:hypothetical protein